MALEPPAGPKWYVKPLNEGIRPIEMLITAKCPHLEVIVRWADRFYTPGAAAQNTFGAFGETTRKKADGSYTVLLLSAAPGFDGLDFRKWNRSPADCDCLSICCIHTMKLPKLFYYEADHGESCLSITVPLRGHNLPSSSAGAGGSRALTVLTLPINTINIQ
jgi:hypothetical protein